MHSIIMKYILIFVARNSDAKKAKDVPKLFHLKIQFTYESISVY
jgi:hypothetical protein